MTETPTAQRLPQPRRVLLPAALILACGVAIGASSTILFGGAAAVAPAAPTTATAGRGAAEIVDELRRKQGLSDEQAARLVPIYSERLRAIAAVQREAQERLAGEHERLRDDVRAVLTTEQFARWDEHLQAARSRRAAPGPMKGSTTLPADAGGGGGALPTVDETFRRFDRDADGRITQSELPPPLQDRLMRADANGDGAVTPVELQAARDRVR